MTYKNKEEPIIADLLEKHLDSTQVLPDGTVYSIKRFISSIGDLKIEVYPKDHFPAHFHVVSKQKEIDARFDVNTLELINTKYGQISKRDIIRIKHFFETNPNILNRLKQEYLRLNK